MINAVCQGYGEGCDKATRPDPRFPRLDDGDEVLCEDCFNAAIEEMLELLEFELELVYERS